jgi:predicted kinase
MPIFYLICGIPASGKSSVAEKIAAKTSAVIISSDEIRRKIYKDKVYNPNQNKETFAMVRRQFRTALNSNQNIILDAINAWPSERKLYGSRAKKRGYRIVCVFCEKHYIYAINANRVRGDEYKKNIPAHIIKKHYYKFRPPDKSEGWDEIQINNGDRYSVVIERQKPLGVHRSIYLGVHKSPKTE